MLFRSMEGGIWRTVTGEGAIGSITNSSGRKRVRGENESHGCAVAHSMQSPQKRRERTRNKVHVLTALGYFWWAIE